MPNRLIREGFLDSEAVHNLTDAAECFFHRLLLAADDAGRIDGRAEILRARLFPLDISRRTSDVENQLSECVKEGLVIPYKWEGRPFLQIAKCQRSSPCTTSKFPWVDGSFRIRYVRRETRDGEKEFVFSSLRNPLPNPSASLPNPSGPDPRECPQSEAGTESKTEAGTGACHPIPSEPFRLDEKTNNALLSAIGRAGDHFSAMEMEDVLALLREGSTIEDFKAAFEDTRRRGKPKRTMAYLRNIVRDMRDMRLNPKSAGASGKSRRKTNAELAAEIEAEEAERRRSIGNR
jgi:hypothetical protein